MLLLLTIALQAVPCPKRVGPIADSAWVAYRAGRITEAAQRFAAADSLCRAVHDVQLGLGFVALRQGVPADAVRRFTAAIASDSNDADAWYGLGLARARSADRAAAAAAFRRTLKLAPKYADAEQQLLALGEDGAVLAPIRRPRRAQIPARTHGERFEIRRDSLWVPFYVKGINLGAALPGKFPSEFPPDDSTYARWLAQIAGAHANVVRLYTILPPGFYRAVRQWNAGHPQQALWLVHGVWAEPPPNDNYDDSLWKADFRAEMRRVVDLLHGHAVLPARLGHAFGRYTADVSDHVLAVIIGREWEPFTIKNYNQQAVRRASDVGETVRRASYVGRFLAVDSGTPADAWMAEQCDYMLGYEWDRYHAQRPIAYTNWPTLDPLHHPTEPSLEEEVDLRDRLGLPTKLRLHEYDNDGQSLDAMLVRTTAADSAGYFASYHAYPYYPDFIDLDSTYGAARSSYGPSHYFGYLTDLRRHHAGRPVVIAEYGVPSSRGLAHLQPEGLHHGGHDEREMADQDVRLTREIHEAGLAGGILFAWQDEWFKHNWVVIDLELPRDRTRLWDNTMDAEQQYGLLGHYPGNAVHPSPELGGDPAPWKALAPVGDSGGVTLRAGSDEGYLYLALTTVARPESTQTLIGIDTYRPDRGAFHMPGVAARLTNGIEFLVTLDSVGRVYVARHYNPYVGPHPGMGPTDLDAFYNDSCTVDAAIDSEPFDSLFVTTNRLRVTRNLEVFPARGVNRGLLRFGMQSASSLSDWYVDSAAGLIEVRLPWGLLNVTDPSSRTLLERVNRSGDFTTVTTDGFRFVVATVDPKTRASRVQIPASAPYAWAPWDVPKSHERLKPAYAAMQQLWGENW